MADVLEFSKSHSSNQKRLESIKRRKLEKASQKKHISEALSNLDNSVLKNKKITFDSDDEINSDKNKSPNKKIKQKKQTTNNFSLFDSSDTEEEENEDYDKRFEIKKQYEGVKGRELFELNSQITDERFKLDERFKDDDENSSYLVSENLNSVEHKDIEFEKEKNLEILEEVLGFQIPKKHPEEKQKNKRKYMRFDPESTNASEFIRKLDATQEEIKKKHNDCEDKSNMDDKPIVSTERFFEITTNLKDLLNNDKSISSTKFNFGQNWKDSLVETKANETPELLWSNRENIKEKKINMDSTSPSTTLPNQILQSKTFFMEPGDNRLKDGVNFFHWTKSLDTIRDQWPVMRNILIEAYKKNRRTNFQPTKQKVKRFQKTKKNFK